SLTPLLSHWNRSAVGAGLLSITVARAFHSPVPLKLRVKLQTGLLLPKVEENVSVIAPEVSPLPEPVLAMMMPALSVLPLSSEHDDPDPPPDVKLQVGVAPLAFRRGNIPIPVIAKSPFLLRDSFLAPSNMRFNVWSPPWT